MLSPNATSSTKHLFGHVAIGLRHGNASLWLRPCPLNWMVFVLLLLCFCCLFYLSFDFCSLVFCLSLVCLSFGFISSEFNQKQTKNNNSISDLQNYFVFLLVSVHLFFCLSLFWFYLSQSSEFNQKQKIKKNPAYLICFCFLFVPYLFLFWCYLIRIQSKTKN